MVGYRFRLNNENWFEKLIAGRKYALSDDEESQFAWESTKGIIEINDGFFMVDLGIDGWIDFAPEEFTPEMISFMFECNSDLATEEVLKAFWKAHDEAAKKKVEEKK